MHSTKSSLHTIQYTYMPRVRCWVVQLLLYHHYTSFSLPNPFHETPAYLTFVVVQLCEDSYFEIFVHPLLLNQVLVDNSIYGYLELVSRNCYWDPRSACNDQRTAFRL